jgi:hypothetical protein
MEATPAAKPRIARFIPLLHTPKEVSEGTIEPPKGLLQDLCIDGGDVLALGFDLRKLSTLPDIPDALSVCAVRIASFLKGSVIELSACLEPSVEGPSAGSQELVCNDGPLQ